MCRICPERRVQMRDNREKISSTLLHRIFLPVEQIIDDAAHPQITEGVAKLHFTATARFSHLRLLGMAALFSTVQAAKRLDRQTVHAHKLYIGLSRSSKYQWNPAMGKDSQVFWHGLVFTS